MAEYKPHGARNYAAKTSTAYAAGLGLIIAMLDLFFLPGIWQIGLICSGVALMPVGLGLYLTARRSDVADYEFDRFVELMIENPRITLVENASKTRVFLIDGGPGQNIALSRSQDNFVRYEAAGSDASDFAIAAWRQLRSEIRLARNKQTSAPSPIQEA
jgi:hypothetical protein